MQCLAALIRDRRFGRLGQPRKTGSRHLSWVGQYVGTHAQRELARAKQWLRFIEVLGRKLQGEPDERLKNRARMLMERARGGASPDDLLVECFALVREVSHRQIGLRHFDVQILGGAALHRGNVVEMKTGEGKTLVATLPVVLRALYGKGAHVVTVNDYLAERDARWMEPIYRFMGLTVGVLSEEMDHAIFKKDRQASYRADITYVNNHELVFDYLRDNLCLSRDEQVQRPLHFALVDEVDLLLLDEAGTPLIISGEAQGGEDFSRRAREVVARLKKGTDFKVDHKTRSALVQERGWAEMERMLGIDNLADPKHLAWQHALHNAILAHAVYKRDVDYIVHDDEIQLIDDYTGRVSPDKRMSDGVHQALEAKEGVRVRSEDQTLAKASYQMFFRLYPALCGMTGTAYSAREELRITYGLPVIRVPTNQPVLRKDEPSLVYRSSEEKFQAVVEAVEQLKAQGRPVLLGTTSVRESEQVAGLLKAKGIAHTVLNAKDDQQEAEIIAQAGRPGAVTVSTNMAGRGVDIELGGSTEGNVTSSDRDRVVQAGGLMVMGTGLHESRRIDDQLRGRAGRQGDPGGSRYYLSLDDPIYKKFGQIDKGAQVLESLRQRLIEHPQGEPIDQRSVLVALEGLQKKVEVENQAIRKEVLKFDTVVDVQRRTIYKWRQTLLDQEPKETLTLLKEMAEKLEETPASPDDEIPELNPAEIKARLDQFETLLGPEALARIAAQVMLDTIDALWTEHLNNLEQLDDDVNFRTYGQLDPLLEYKREAHELYQTLLARIRAKTLAYLMDVLSEE
ncbi:MAG: preprotein translocase subunit SecA [Myxococcota bacterium]|nr:preprotein translocase subunit SecA [Myxococcota bacterium]